MKGLAQGANRLSKSIDALSGLTDRLVARRSPIRNVVKVADDFDLFKAVSMPTVETATYPEGVSRLGATSPAARQEAGRSTNTDEEVDRTPTPTRPPTTRTPTAGVTEAPLPYSAAKKRFITLEKYSPDQPRDERGRWTAGGVATAALATIGGAALIGGGILLARNPALFAGVGRNMMRVGGKPKPMGAGAAAAAKPTGLNQKVTKPFAELGARQQRRRMAAARAEALRRGATHAEADAIVAQMRARALAAEEAARRSTAAASASEAAASRSVAAAPTRTGLSRARPGATITTPNAVALEQSRIASEVARYEAALKEYNLLAASKTLTTPQFNRREYLFNEMDALARSIARREKALGRTSRLTLARPRRR